MEANKINFPKVIFLFGLPGSGKGTQADILSERLGYYHFDTGREVEKIVMDPALQSDPVIQRERKNFETGMLTTPAWFEDMVRDRITTYAREGRRLVFSGSPRTLEEVANLYPLIGKLFGEKDLLGFLISIDDETSVYRNSNRRVCRDCRMSVIWNVSTELWKFCPKCGAPLVRRVLDKADVIRERIKEYRNRTEPTLKFLKDKGVVIKDINGEQLPEVVARDISAYLESLIP